MTCITRRLPTPPPDVIERITVIKPPRDVVNLCIEKPYQPSPCFQQREICGKPRKPLIQPRVVSVAPRSNHYSAVQAFMQQQQPFVLPQTQSLSQPPLPLLAQTLSQPQQQPQQVSSYAQNSYYGSVFGGYSGQPSGYHTGYGPSSYFGSQNVC